MDESWRELREAHERLRWARLHRTEFQRPIDAARSLNIKPGTFRTYEFAKADGGRTPPLSELQRICAKYRVSWSWIATGQGNPDQGVQSELQQLASELAIKIEKVSAAKKEDAIRAVEAVLASFAS